MKLEHVLKLLMDMVLVREYFRIFEMEGLLDEWLQEIAE